jgi:hypothetical protein
MMSTYILRRCAGEKMALSPQQSFFLFTSSRSIHAGNRITEVSSTVRIRALFFNLLPLMRKCRNSTVINREGPQMIRIKRLTGIHSIIGDYWQPSADGMADFF